MAWLKRNRPPEYDRLRSYEDNFTQFFDWCTGLKDPHKQIPEVGDDLDYGIKIHPIGFMAVYLSEQDSGVCAPTTAGLVRANIYPPGAVMKDDIHCHGFNFRSGVVSGGLINTMHYPDFSARAPDGEGYVGYESGVDVRGQNYTVRATGATVVIAGNEAKEIGPGETYTMRPKIDFHSVGAVDEGAVTLFCKTPTLEGSDGLTIVLRSPEREATPERY